MSYNLRLDENTHDLVMGRQGAERVAGVDLTKQLVKCRLLTVLGEWAPVPTLGLPWFDEIMIKGQRLSVIEGLLRDCILQTDHVLDLLSFNMTLDKATRTLSVSFEAVSDWGQFDIVVTKVGGI
jgi:hypothetical protein